MTTHPDRLPNGTRVRIQIADKTRFAQGAATALDNLTGDIVDFNPESTNGSTFNGPAYLVQLDRKPPKWWSNQLPTRYHWFAPEDLVTM